jgi:hypothetical protein
MELPLEEAHEDDARRPVGGTGRATQSGGLTSAAAPVPARLVVCVLGAAAAIGGRVALLSARGRNLVPLVHSFIQEIHLSAVAGESPTRAVLEASAHAPEPLGG